MNYNDEWNYQNSPNPGNSRWLLTQEKKINRAFKIMTKPRLNHQMCFLIIFQLSQNLHQMYTHTKNSNSRLSFCIFLLSTQAIYLPRMRNYPPRMTSIISLMRLDETRSAGPLRLMSGTAAASGGDLARRCLRVGRRLLRQTAGVIPESLLGVMWTASACWSQIRSEHTQSHTRFALLAG